MPRKTYSEEFKRDAVALYENSTGTSIQTIATDLGINRNTLQNWLQKYGTGARTKITAIESASVTEAERIRQLEREVIRLREERDIVAKSS